MPSSSIIVSQQPDAITNLPGISVGSSCASEPSVNPAMPKQITVIDTAGSSSQETSNNSDSNLAAKPIVSDPLKYTLLDMTALATRVVNSMPENSQYHVDDEVLSLISHVSPLLI